MRKMFYEEYTEEMDGMRNSLLQFHLEFQGLKEAAKRDYLHGLISEEEYKRAQEFRFDEFYTGQNGEKSPYSLSRKKVELIKKYANLNDEGELLLESLKSEIKDNQNKLYKIFNSIRTFYYYSSLDFESAKKTFLQVVFNDYNNRISRLGSAFESGASQVEIDNRSFRHDNIMVEIQRLQLQKERALVKIEEADLNQLYEMISDYSGVDYKYFDWFRLRTIQQDAKSVEMYEQHNHRLNLIQKIQESIRAKQANYASVTKKFGDMQSKYLEFAQKQEEMKASEQKEKGLRYRLRKLGFHKKDNTIELCECFHSLDNLPGFEDYISSLDNYNDTDSFKIYMSNRYPLITYVDRELFKRNLIEDIQKYLINQLTLLRIGISEMSNIIFNEMKNLHENINQATQESNYMTEVSNSLKVNLSVPGLDKKEEDRIFDDMTIYFRTGYVEEMKRAEEKRMQDELRNSEEDYKQSY